MILPPLSSDFALPKTRKCRHTDNSPDDTLTHFGCVGTIFGRDDYWRSTGEKLKVLFHFLKATADEFSRGATELEIGWDSLCPRRGADYGSRHAHDVASRQKKNRSRTAGKVGEGEGAAEKGCLNSDRGACCKYAAGFRASSESLNDVH
jgi:hypothetical protein